MYQRFEAETLQAALNLVKKEFGPDAMIVNHREVRKGGLGGILGKKVWQVIAYRKPSDPPQAPATSSATSRPAQSQRSNPTARPDAQKDRGERPRMPRVRNPVNHLIDEPALPFEDLSKSTTATYGGQVPNGTGMTSQSVQSPSTLPTAKRPGIAPSPSRPVTSAPAMPVQGAHSADPSALSQLLKEVREISERLNGPQAGGDQVILPGVLPGMYQKLISQEVYRELAVELMNCLCDRPSLDLCDESKVLEILEEQLAAALPTMGLEELFSSRRPRTLFLVGPSGVGKTTTLSKVAALASRDEKMKIAFITLDTFRVAAAEQLKTYADLIPAAIEVVMSEDEFIAALFKHSDKDMIFVDTPGKNPCSPAALSDLSGYLKKMSAAKLPSPAILLVLSATTKHTDLQRYAACYQSLDPAGIVFTKLDETSTHGSLLQVLSASKLPMIYLTCGKSHSYLISFHMN